MKIIYFSNSLNLAKNLLEFVLKKQLSRFVSSKKLMREYAILFGVIVRVSI